MATILLDVNLDARVLVGEQHRPARPQYMVHGDLGGVTVPPAQPPLVNGGRRVHVNEIMTKGTQENPVAGALIRPSRPEHPVVDVEAAAFTSATCAFPSVAFFNLRVAGVHSSVTLLSENWV